MENKKENWFIREWKKSYNFKGLVITTIIAITLVALIFLILYLNGGQIRLFYLK